MAYQTYKPMIPDAPAPEGPTLALFEAVEMGDLPPAKGSLRAGADVNGIDRRLEGRTPLNVAVEFGHAKLAKLLLDHGARLDLGTFSNLAVAFERNDLKMLELLVKAGADPDDLQEDAEDVEWQRDGLNDTPLIRAVREGNRNMVRRLLALGADPNRLERQGVCALAIAVIRKDRAMRNLLEPVTDPVLRASALDVKNVMAARKRQDTFIHAAAEGDLETVRRMIAEGIDVDAAGEGNPQPATIFAAWRGHLDVLRTLIDAGASIHGARHYPLIAFAARSTSPDAVRYLLDLGADVNAVDADLGPPILEAGGHGNVETVKLLLARGADPRMSNCYGYTAQSAMERNRNAPISEDERLAYEEIGRLLSANHAQRGRSHEA